MGFAWPWPDLHIARLTGHIREAAPIGAAELAWAFMWYFCTVLLGLLFTDASLGWFGASHRALMALHTFVWLYFFNLLPSISRCANLPLVHLLKLMDQSVRFTAWTGVFAAGLLTAIAPALLTLIYGPAFRGAAHSFAILAWMLPLALISGHHRYILIAYNCQKRLMYCTIAAAVAAVLLGLTSVPLYGGVGAAWALLIANAIHSVLVYVSVKQLIVEIPVHAQFALPLSALAVSAVLYFTLVKWNLWAAVAASCVVYVATLIWTDGRRLTTFIQMLFGNIRLRVTPEDGAI